MTTNEETIAMGGERMEEKKEVKKDTASATWKNVAIGGVTGVMFGAGTAYAANKLTEGDEPTEGSGTHDISVDSSDVADVKAGQSFGEAFADARAQVGPGGVFRWHDDVYSTYLKEEWDALSPEEQRQFTKNAINATKNTGDGSVVHVNTEDGHGGVQDEAQTQEPTEAPIAESTAEQNIVVNNNVNVHIVGARDGQHGDNDVVTVEIPAIGSAESDVLVVNLDNSDVCCVEQSELDNCCQIDEDEIANISSVEASGTDEDINMNLYTSNDITSDIPDCMNDADVQQV